MTKRVAITGMGAVTAFGESWDNIKKGLLSVLLQGERRL